MRNACDFLDELRLRAVSPELSWDDDEGRYYSLLCSEQEEWRPAFDDGHRYTLADHAREYDPDWSLGAEIFDKSTPNSPTISSGYACDDRLSTIEPANEPAKRERSRDNKTWERSSNWFFSRTNGSYDKSKDTVRSMLLERKRAQGIIDEIEYERLLQQDRIARLLDRELQLAEESASSDARPLLQAVSKLLRLGFS